MGIYTDSGDQVVFVDTPGMHLEQGKAINRYMNRAASSALADVDLVLFVVDRNRWTSEDDLVLEALQHTETPVALVINKIDRLEDQAVYYPGRNLFGPSTGSTLYSLFQHSDRRNLPALMTYIRNKMPSGVHFFPEDQVTDRSERFLAAELIREKIVRQLGDEMPYTTAVEIESFKLDGKLLRIDALIYVERQGQKKIVIGEGGSRLRSIGTEARKDMEMAFSGKVMLKLWVKVKSGWSDDERALRSLGFEDGI
jgi:GTP-binding protein Era